MNDESISPSSTITIQSEGKASSRGRVVQEHSGSRDLEVNEDMQHINSTPSTSDTRTTRWPIAI